MTYFVYILRCRGGKLYTGITTDVKRRFSEHLSGMGGAKFTKANPPEAVEALWKCEGRASATRLECAVKKLTREKKVRLIAGESVLGDIGGIFGAIPVDTDEI